MNVVTEVKYARYGMSCVLIAFALNIGFLISPFPIETLPTYPLVLLARYFEPLDAPLSATLHFLAFTWGRFIWLIVIFVGAICGLRAKDVGIRWSQWKKGVLVTLIMWMIIEVMLVGSVLLLKRPLSWNPLWGKLTPAAVTAIVIYYFLGVALFEEVFYRGFMVPQFFHAFQNRFSKQSLVLAVLVSQLLFALSHIPHYQMPFPLPIGLGILWLSGVLLAWMWLRTGNLVIAIGWHGLMDFPLHLVAAPPNVPEGITFLVGILLLIVWPFLDRHLPQT
ncbi:MAG: CPBP family intramembrane metalloprotease [Thermococcus sp.]|uniref:CPBP family intramembrane glutamic endopeptidase n=1 Tax=Thermococcus sp. TaxID=35749 RepID=UPI001E0ED440|nr:CPBP family intramembrane glutamic endopeptidase [Thermococcus sp.]MBO8173990.1 CPBP family intramembrane metalloprotease [Thermococcus sp.]